MFSLPKISIPNQYREAAINWGTCALGALLLNANRVVVSVRQINIGSDGKFHGVEGETFGEGVGTDIHALAIGVFVGRELYKRQNKPLTGICAAVLTSYLISNLIDRVNPQLKFYVALASCIAGVAIELFTKPATKGRQSLLESEERVEETFPEEREYFSGEEEVDQDKARHELYRKSDSGLEPDTSPQGTS